MPKQSEVDIFSPRCPKCGSGDDKINIRWIRKGVETKPLNSDSPLLLPAKSEHLRCTCTRCQYEWAEQTSEQRRARIAESLTDTMSK